MFSKIKHGFDRKAKRLVALMLAASMLCGIAGCTKEPSESPEDINDTSIELSNDNDEIGFDIDRVRKSIIIKGQTIEIPVKLGEIRQTSIPQQQTDYPIPLVLAQSQSEVLLPL